MNPFQYQGPVTPSELIDRHDELDALQRAAADRVNVRLAAPRRYGKSSLLDAHIATMRDAGHRAVRVDFYRVATVTDVASRLATAYRQLPADPTKLFDRMSRQLGLTFGPAGVTVQIGPRGAQAAPDPDRARQILLELLDLPARLHEADEGLTVVCFDEFQDLLTADDKLDGLFRSVIQHHAASAAYVYAGSRPSLMRAMFSDRERPFFGQARPLTLPPLPAEAVIPELARTFESEGLDPGTALVDVVELGAGHPQRTMLLAHHLFNALAENGRDDPAAVALDRALDETTDAHQATWEALDRPERAVVVALADGASPTGTRTAREHAIPRGTMQHALERLVREEHLVGEGPVLLDPLFAEWLRRR